MEVEADSMEATPKGEKEGCKSYLKDKEISHSHSTKLGPIDDLNLKERIEQGEKLIQKQNQTRSEMMEKLEIKKLDRNHVISQLQRPSHGSGVERIINWKKTEIRYLTEWDGDDMVSKLKGPYCGYEAMHFLNWKQMEIDYLQHTLSKLRCSKKSSKRTPNGPPSAATDLDEKVKSLSYRVQHGSRSLAEEKQVLNEIKQAEFAREKRTIDNVVQPWFRSYYRFEEVKVSKAAIKNRIILISSDLHGLKKEQQTFRAKVKRLERELKDAEGNISSLQKKLTNIERQRYKAYENVLELEKQLNEVF
ncbi:unnamed protein product [Ilex paraguariensis]|uniref:Uncharacterized protein n=1 Tax=Ilex paraguariensis TaxID=185542 RepID=A0ABC8TTA3_9AQUA